MRKRRADRDSPREQAGKKSQPEGAALHKEVRRKDRADSAAMEQEAKLVAFLVGSGVPSDQLDQYLPGSKATLTRRLQWARDQGYLRSRLHYDPDLLTPEDIAQFELFPMGKKLEEALRSAVGKVPLRKVTIVPNDESSGLTLERVGAAAALRLKQHAHLGKMRLVGVSWGGTMAATARAASRLFSTAAAQSRVPVGFFPVCGDLLHPEEEDDYSLAASSLAAEFARAFHGAVPANQRYLWSPAYIPWEFLQAARSSKQAEADRKVIVRFVTSLPSYRDILGSRRNGQDSGEAAPLSLVQQADTLLSGVGDIASIADNDPRHMWFHLTGFLAPDDKQELRDAAVGDLSGQFVARRAKDQALIDRRINSRMFGPSLADFADCAQRTQENGTPGPIVIAVGEHKAEIVTTICLRGLVSEIVVDARLAHAMAALLKVNLSNPRP
jgi:DNA-binding transcriptional regulator LsrR (DeoR family)